MNSNLYSIANTHDMNVSPGQDSSEKHPVLSATIHPVIKWTLVAMSKRTGMTVSQVADEVLYTGLLEMQELGDPR